MTTHVIPFATCILLFRSARGSAAQAPAADRHVPSRPETVAWGAFPKDKPPVARIKSGQTVRIDTLSHAGATQDENPVDYLGKYGVKPDEILKDVMDFWAARATLRQAGNGGGHVLTGPIYVENAEPGDTLEVQILSLTPRVPYGMNSTGSNGGVFRKSYAMKEGDPPLRRAGRQHTAPVSNGEGGREGRRILRRRHPGAAEPDDGHHGCRPA